ncbi:nitroreductase family protein [Saccharopolyspora sp. WRP15-2]|uniref:Nitroreductase family protein n=1 Tax=Saccharopolyspora oryzae TaxID=2997343 RepID=A0ABT4UTV4_9PSEU|nr:nitroreductase family protein [Saccharopolyspora oryzae]MDA3625153.1 nitroreductase family protein [Saccharopolyspora oryzae]
MSAVPGDAGGHRGWSAEESAVINRAVHNAPSVHNSRPWSLELRDRTAELRERPTLLAQHDPGGRDRRISCGAALANLVLAVRGLGWAVEEKLGSDAGLVLAAVTATGRAEPSEVERRRSEAVLERRSYREAFDGSELPESTRDALLEAVAAPGVTGRWISGADETLAVARLLTYAARVFRGNAEYQRELSSWTTEAGDGLRRDAFGERGLAAVGLTTGRTHLPDESALAARMQREAVLVVGVQTDGPVDQVRAGAAVEQAWLEATGRGLVASVMTQPLHLAEVRSELAAGLGFAEAPQVLMRVGRPARR